MEREESAAQQTVNKNCVIKYHKINNKTVTLVYLSCAAQQCANLLSNIFITTGLKKEKTKASIRGSLLWLAVFLCVCGDYVYSFIIFIGINQDVFSIFIA